MIVAKDNADKTRVLPNFLIVGVGKSGTTTLYYILKEHPDIFMSPVKEPCFFSAQFLNLPQKGIQDEKKLFVREFADYCTLFADVKNEKAIGEASADTIYYYEHTIPMIKQVLGEPRIIIMLRNPVDRAYSNYMHLWRDNREYLSFEDGLAQEEARIRNAWQVMWYYKKRGLYYDQVKAFMEAFSHVHVVLTDELKKNPQDTLKGVYEFLEVATDFQTTQTRKQYNISGFPRFKTFNNFFLMKNAFQRTVRAVGSFLLTADRYAKFRDAIRAKFFIRVDMKPETRAYLQNEFRDDILKLQDLLQKDLSGWLKPKNLKEKQ